MEFCLDEPPSNWRIGKRENAICSLRSFGLNIEQEFCKKIADTLTGGTLCLLGFCPTCGHKEDLSDRRHGPMNGRNSRRKTKCTSRQCVSAIFRSPCQNLSSKPLKVPRAFKFKKNSTLKAGPACMWDAFCLLVYRTTV